MLEKYVLRIKTTNQCFITTAQKKPFHKVYNSGEYNGGNRCVFIVKGCRAKSVKLAEFDFDDQSVDIIKKKDVKWE